jgi:L-arabinose isomerase
MTIKAPVRQMGAVDQYIDIKPAATPRIGVFSVAHAVYFEQFPKLAATLDGYYRHFIETVCEYDADVLDYGMADTYEKGLMISTKMQADDLDVIFCDMVTYATSSVFAPIVRNLSAPIVLVALQPMDGMDYTWACTEMQLENDSICSVPEFAYAANRLGHKIADVIIGTLDDDLDAREQLARWCVIARVLRAFKGTRIGLMGHVLESMYDMHTDPTAVSATFGVHIPLLEIDDMLALSGQVTDGEIEQKLDMIYELFDLPDPKNDPVTVKASGEELRKAARTAVVMDKLVAQENLAGLAYFYEGLPGTAHREMVDSFIVGNSLLINRGIPVCGEYDLKTCLAMLMMDRMGIGGSLAELHPFDFREDFILIGHDGPHHIAIAEGRPVLRGLKKYHGKQGSGVSVEFKIKEGPITILGITQKQDGRFKMVIGEGISRHGPIPATGNTNTRGFFLPNTKEFIKAWISECPTHHFALGVGHHAKTIQKIGEIMGIETVIVKP